MSRKEFSKKVKLAALKRADGKCEGCGQPLQPGRFQFDHVVPDGLGGEPTLENCKVLCSGSRASCHGIKTHEEDTPRMRKADAQRDVHNGTTKARRRIPQKPKMKREGKPPLKPRDLYKKVG